MQTDQTTETPEDRVDALTDEQCRAILLRIVKTVHAYPAPPTREILIALREWSLA